jgi:hypothetical protein
MNGEPYSYSAAEAGPLIGHTGNWMLENARDRVIPHSKIGHEIRFTPDHLRQILAACEVPPKAPLRPRATARRKTPLAEAQPAAPALRARPPKTSKRGAA